MTVDYAERFPSFTYDRPRDGVLRITFDAPGLNSVGPDAHREIAEIWREIDRDADVQVAIRRCSSQTSGETSTYASVVASSQSRSSASVGSARWRHWSEG